MSRAVAFAAACAAVVSVAAAPTPASAFCGFYVGGAGAKMFNNATEVVLMRLGTTTVLSMQNAYEGPPEHFAMVVPVPTVLHEQDVQTLPRELFDKIDILGAPRLVEYWEQDPCAPAVPYGRTFSGASSVENQYIVDGARTTTAAAVKIEAKFSVGEYDIVVLSALESTALDRWLRDHYYEIPPGAEPLLRPYVEQGTKFFVAKIDPSKVKFENGRAVLSPLRFHYDSPEFSLPIRLGLAASPGTQDLIVNILAPNGTRYEVANYPNATIPTNLIVRDGVRNHFAEFYASLFDYTLAKLPGAVVTEYAWSSSSCDPCPGPTLDPTDVLTLGADVLGDKYRDGGGASYTLTRLHARYGRDISNDLVFRAVEPIVGGRGIPDGRGELPSDVTRDQDNNFQGRYAILHPWTGAVACATPLRGIWGGPRGEDPFGDQAAIPATKLASAPRGTIDLAAVVASEPKVSLLDSKGLMLPIPLPAPPRPPQACVGCATDSAGGDVGVTLGGVGVLAWVTRRRRRGKAGRDSVRTGS